MPSLISTEQEQLGLGLLYIIVNIIIDSIIDTIDIWYEVLYFFHKCGQESKTPVLYKSVSQQPPLQDQVLFQGRSLADNTISKYAPLQGGMPQNFHTHTGRDGKLYPFDPGKLDFTGCYEVGFRGYYKCDHQPAHKFRSNCPLAHFKDKQVIDGFYRDFCIYKPNLKEK